MQNHTNSSSFAVAVYWYLVEKSWTWALCSHAIKLGGHRHRRQLAHSKVLASPYFIPYLHRQKLVLFFFSLFFSPSKFRSFGLDPSRKEKASLTWWLHTMIDLIMERLWLISWQIGAKENIFHLREDRKSHPCIMSDITSEIHLFAFQDLISRC